MDRFNFLAALRKGESGKVILAEEKRADNLYATKTIEKVFMIGNVERNEEARCTKISSGFIGLLR